MQSSYFVGKQYNDTVISTDANIFQKYSGPHKVSKVHIFHDNKVIFGLQFEYTIYESNKAIVVEGHKFIGNQAHNVNTETFALDGDEFIVVVFGRHGDLFDGVGFKTTKGREVYKGGNGGNGFELKAEIGHHFNSLTAGLGGHLHSINFGTGELPKPKIVTSETLIAGTTHNDTVEHNDEKLLASTNGHHKIHAIHIFHDKKVVFGFEVIYATPGFGGQWVEIQGGKWIGNQANHVETTTLKLDYGEFVIQAHGRCGDYMDALGFKTSYGKEVTVGGSGGKAWELLAPSGQHFASLSAGIGGHLHFIKVHIHDQPQQSYNQYSQQNVQIDISNQFQQKVIIQEQVQTTIFSAGKTHNDTSAFSDAGYLVSLSGHQKIHKIKFWVDHEYVYGLQVIYSAPGGFGNKHILVEGGKHVGSQLKHGVKEEVLELGDNEFVVEFHGTYSDVINSLGLKTSSGRDVLVGGKGSNHFELKAPFGYQFNSISGGLGGHLHNLTVEAHKI